jgi:predicted transposase YbfD/YdcC
VDLADTVVTADALHTQREHADWLVTAKRAAYLPMVKANQPTLAHLADYIRGHWGITSP